MGYSSLNNNENMPYPEWNCLMYGSPQPPYWIHDIALLTYLYTLRHRRVAFLNENKSICHFY